MLLLKHVSLVVQTDSKVPILKDISFAFEPHKIYVNTGPNGAGKSSLTKILMSSYKPTAGCISFNGHDITSLSITERARLGIGYFFQYHLNSRVLKSESC